MKAKNIFSQGYIGVEEENWRADVRLDGVREANYLSEVTRI